jgi:hypothetical protein
MTEFFTSLYRYQALILTCPKLYFIDFDFWRELLFIVERDANLMKQSGWMIAGAQQIQHLTQQRNTNIEFEINLKEEDSIIMFSTASYRSM